MLHPIQTRVHIPNSPEILGGSIAAVGMGAVLSLDRLQGSRARREFRAHPEFYTAEEPNAGETLGFLPGCQVNGRSVFNRVRSHVENQDIIVAGYPERSFDIEQICEGLGRELMNQRANKPNFICQSMGSIVMRHFLEYARINGISERTEGFGNIVFDDPIHDYTDVQPKYRLLLKAATSTRNSWIIDQLKPSVMSHITKRVDSFSNDTHLETIASQGSFIMRTDHPNGVYDDLVESVYYIHGPSGDKVARTQQALQKYRANFPTKLIEIVDQDRAPLSHTAEEAELPTLLRYANRRSILSELTEQYHTA